MSNDDTDVKKQKKTVSEESWTPDVPEAPAVPEPPAVPEDSLEGLLRQTTTFLLHILWGIVINMLLIKIPRQIYRICRYIVTSLYNLIKNIVIWLYRHIGTIVRCTFYLAAIIVILAVLLMVVFAPKFIISDEETGTAVTILWFILLVIPGAVFGIRRWLKKRSTRKKIGVVKKETSETSAALEQTAEGKAEKQ